MVVVRSIPYSFQNKIIYLIRLLAILGTVFLVFPYAVIKLILDTLVFLLDVLVGNIDEEFHNLINE